MSIQIKMDKSLSAVEAMLGRKLKGTEKDIYQLAKGDPNYRFIKGENGFLEAHHIRKITESAEYATVKGATTDMVYHPETADIRGEIESR